MEAKFNSICNSERSFHTNSMGSAIKMQNQVDRTVGDGMSMSAFSDLKRNIALTKGKNGSPEFDNEITRLDDVFHKARNGY